jgi:hypothetical protein
VLHKSLYFIDHGAALYFHHDWKDPAASARSPFAPIKDHILLPWASRLEEADRVFNAKLGEDVFAAIVESVPDAWLLPEPGIPTPGMKRRAYVDYLLERLNAAPVFLEEAVRARLV